MGLAPVVGLVPARVRLVMGARRASRVGLAAAVVVVAALVLPAPSTMAAALAQPVQAYDYGYVYPPPYSYNYAYRPPACPYRYHWECWFDPYGRRGCGCRPDFGLYTNFY